MGHAMLAAALSADQQWVANGLFTLVLAYMSWTVRRLVRQNDAQHDKQDGRLMQLTEALDSERRARYEACAETDARLADVREERPRRAEVMGEYARLSDKIGEVSERVAEVAGAIRNQRGA